MCYRGSTVKPLKATAVHHRTEKDEPVTADVATFRTASTMVSQTHTAQLGPKCLQCPGAARAPMDNPTTRTAAGSHLDSTLLHESTHTYRVNTTKGEGFGGTGCDM